MASLLDRMNISSNGAGPVRTGLTRARSAPYQRPPKRDTDSPWSHDLFESHNSLSARLSSHPSPHPSKVSVNPLAQRALSSLNQQSSSQGINIKGASSNQTGNVVEVKGLVSGTTVEDVSAIFKRCGPIIPQGCKLVSSEKDPVIRITYKESANAQEAVKKFNGQVADGKTLSVRIIGGTSTALAGRLGVGISGAGGTASVDVLMDGDDDTSGSKMRSDSIMTDPRASVMLAPPGANVKDYIPATVQASVGGRRGGGRGRGRGGRGRRGGLSERMDV